MAAIPSHRRFLFLAAGAAVASCCSDVRWVQKGVVTPTKHAVVAPAARKGVVTPTKHGVVTAKPMAFFADLDGTLHGTSLQAQQALQDWTTYWQESERAVGSVLCYNTGRCITEYESILQPDLPVPDVLITGDGTEIRWRRDSNGAQAQPLHCFDLDTAWAKAVESSWDRVRDRVVAALDADDEGHIADLNVLSNSPPRGENRWAITVLGKDRACKLAASYEAQFAADGISCYAMGGWGVEGCHLVVAVPKACGKLNAARYVQQRLGLADEACVAAGDSENDLPMVRGGCGYGFIMVANAAGSLASALDDAATPELHYRARGDFARGVIEGLEYFRTRMDVNVGAAAPPAECPEPAAPAVQRHQV